MSEPVAFPCLLGLNPRSRKPLLPFNSAHSKTVKRAIASLVLECALQKSCEHAASTSFGQQVERLRSSRYPEIVLVATVESLLQKIKGKRRSKERQKSAVKCWNEENGCDAIMTVSDMLKHFDEDCVRHTTRCPNCSALVLCTNVCAHRRGNCTTHDLPVDKG
ncbi:hypothetical protein HPB52_013796 [Rhipicephalus sanguineus]|uniref:Uncharacterized protein n=1 Tax=Rhipicephalus sanguineus TaxID=34632 RepID=A0A9D4SPU5_RHISA|nr:hypothetical protein HPB52_013796 [Rhipicephalus sanguineus]